MNCHDVPYFDKLSRFFVDLVRCSVAARYVEALSEIMIRGKNLGLVNRLNASRDDSSVRSDTISRYTARVLLTDEKTVNGGASANLIFGKGGGSGARQDFPLLFLIPLHYGSARHNKSFHWNPNRVEVVPQ